MSLRLSDSEIEDGLQFVIDEWIGKGQKVPDANSFPLGLANYFSTLTQVPENIKNKYYPNVHLTVEEFLKRQFPKPTHALPGILTEKCYNKNLSNEMPIEILADRKLPPRQFVDKLNSSFRQAILDGMQSVTDPAYAGSCLPLWIIRFWVEMWEMHDIHECWQRGLQWLEQKITSKSGKEAELYVKARQLTQILRWGEETYIPGTNHTATHTFATYLSDNGKMSTSHINMMFSHLSYRVECDETLDSLISVETLRFWDEIKKAKNIDHFNTVSARFMLHLEKRLKDEEIDYLVFPARMDSEEHWLPFRLDFCSNELSYGKLERADSIKLKK